MARQFATTNVVRLVGRATRSGTVAAIASVAALAVAARREGRGAVQPVNATSHWLHGPDAAAVRTVDVPHTAIGFATHHAATLFWAVLFEGLVARRRASTPVSLGQDAIVTAIVAAAIDYLATPRRFTPGWEHVLTRRAMALGYAGLAAGLVAGAWGRRRRPSPSIKG